MASLPEDVRIALGVAVPAGDWARVRSSPGSLVGETYLFLRPRPAAFTRASALDPLRPIALDGPPTLEEGELDACVHLPSGGEILRLDVGYLDRDEVRALFERAAAPVEPAPLAEAAPVDELVVATIAERVAPPVALVEARRELVSLLATRARPGLATPRDDARARLVRLLRARPAPRLGASTHVEISNDVPSPPEDRTFRWIIVAVVLATLVIAIARQ